MRGNLFGTILDNILTESLGEVIVNPNDTSKNVFDYKCRDNKLYIFANLDEDDLKKVAEIDPKLIKNKWAKIEVQLMDLDKPESEGYKKLGEFCKMINGFGKYGNFTPEQLIDDASQYIKDRVRPETAKEVSKSEDELFDELVRNFGKERVQELLKSLRKHTNIPIQGLDHHMNIKNILRILSQDAQKRIPAGKQPATYVAKPDDWRTFNRQIRKDAIPIFLWYKVSESNPTEQAFEQGASNIYGADKSKVLNGRTAAQTYNDFGMGGARTLGPKRALKYATQKVWNTKTNFDIAPYYDIADTEVIPGLEDKFNDPERIGFTDNIKMIPTQASLAKVVDDSGQSVEDLLKNEFGGADDKCAMEVFNALKNIFKGKFAQDAIPTGQDGKVDMDFVRRSIYGIIVDYLKDNNQQMKQLYAKDTTREAIAQVIACLYMSIHRIAPEMLITNLYGRVNQDELQKEAEKCMFSNRNIYNSLAQMIESEVLRNKNNATPVQQNNKPNKVAMEESMNHTNPLDAIRRAWGIEDHTLNNAKSSDSDVADDGINLTNEQRELTEAKFYSMLNKLNNPNF